MGWFADNWMNLIEAGLGLADAKSASDNALSLNERKDLWMFQNPDINTPFMNSTFENINGRPTQTSAMAPWLEEIFMEMVGGMGDRGMRQMSPGIGELGNSITNYQRSRYGLSPTDYDPNFNQPSGDGDDVGETDPPYEPMLGGDLSTGGPPSGGPAVEGNFGSPGNPYGPNYMGGGGWDGPGGRSPNDQWLNEAGLMGLFSGQGGPSGSQWADWQSSPEWFQKGGLAALGAALGIPGLGKMSEWNENRQYGHPSNNPNNDEFIGPPNYGSGAPGTYTGVDSGSGLNDAFGWGQGGNSSFGNAYGLTPLGFGQNPWMDMPWTQREGGPVGYSM
jgi:hypothetical protein